MMKRTGLSWREFEEWTDRQLLLFFFMVVEDITEETRAHKRSRGKKSLSDYER